MKPEHKPEHSLPSQRHPHKLAGAETLIQCIGHGITQHVLAERSVPDIDRHVGYHAYLVVVVRVNRLLVHTGSIHDERTYRTDVSACQRCAGAAASLRIEAWAKMDGPPPVWTNTTAVDAGILPARMSASIPAMALPV